MLSEIRSSIPLWLAIVAVAGCCPPVDRAAQEQELMTADREFARSVADQDVERFRSFLDPDAVFLGSGALRGRDAVAREWTPFLEGQIGLSWSPEQAFVAASGDLGYTVGNAEFRVPTEDGSPRLLHSHYVTVWKRGPDGTWRAAADAGSIPQPPPPN